MSKWKLLVIYKQKLESYVLHLLKAGAWNNVELAFNGSSLKGRVRSVNEDQSAFETVEEMPFSGNCFSEGSVHIRIVNKLYHIYACKHLKK